MINSIHRFHGHNSLHYVYQHGLVARGPNMSIKSAINQRRSTYRSAVVVSKKVSKSAVVRNRIRRRIYEQIRLLETQINKPYDIVITVYNDQLAEVPIAELQKQLNSQLKLAKILSTPSSSSHDKMDKVGE